MRRLLTLSAAALVAACALPAAAQDSMEPAPAKKPQMHAIADLKPGDTAPALTIEKWVKGDSVSAFEKGHVYVVEFWATWCGPCVASMPHLSSIQKHFKDKVTVIGVTSHDKKNTLDKVESMVTEKGDTMGYNVAWDKDRATNTAYMEAGGQQFIPCSFVVDQAGKIAYIGSPEPLEFVLGRVVANKWDTVEGPKELRAVSKQQQSIMHKAQDDPKGALKDADAFAAKYPEFASEVDSMRFAIAIEANDAAAASAAGSRIVDKLIADRNAASLNEFAWGIVDPESTMKVKDNDLALKAALKAVDFTGEKDAAILDTLARCYFVKGDRAKAIQYEKKAVAIGSDNEEIKKSLEAALEEYQKGSN